MFLFVLYDITFRQKESTNRLFSIDIDLMVWKQNVPLPGSFLFSSYIQTPVFFADRLRFPTSFKVQGCQNRESGRPVIYIVPAGLLSLNWTHISRQISTVLFCRQVYLNVITITHNLLKTDFLDSSAVGRRQTVHV